MAYDHRAYENGTNTCNRRTTRSVKIIAAGAVALLAAANTVANAAENANPTQMAQVHHACAVVMGLLPPGDLYNTCVRSLDNTLSELDQGRLLSENRGGCAQKGLMPGTSAFAVCVVD